MIRTFNERHLINSKHSHIPLEHFTDFTDQAPSLISDHDMMKHDCPFLVSNNQTKLQYSLIKCALSELFSSELNLRDHIGRPSLAELSIFFISLD